MSEITYDYISHFLQAIEPEEDEVVSAIRRYAVKQHVPIIKSEVKQLLEVLLIIKKPKRILEIGTAIAYSSIIMSRYLDDNGTMTTIERSDKMVLEARKNIKMAKKEDVITLLHGNAEEHLKILVDHKETYDVIFMDAAKGQYLAFLPFCLKLLKVGGLLISDNVLQNGLIAKSRYSVPRRQRTIHKRMRQFLWELNHHSQLKTSILPISDGLTISYKIV